MKTPNSNRNLFKKFQRSRKCLKKNGIRKSLKTADNNGSYIATINVLLGEDKDKGVYLLKNGAQFERKINRLIRERKLPYRKSQRAINSVYPTFIKYLNQKSK